MTRTVRAQAARNVSRLNATLSCGAKRRAPRTARIEAPARGLPRRRANSTLSVSPRSGILLQRLEVMQVQAVELFADLEEKDAEYQDRHQHIECDAKLHDHRHAVGRTHCTEEQTILH